MNVLIYTGGKWPDDERAKALHRAADFVICCDGAAANAVRLDLMPHVLMGDMDSIDPADRAFLLDRGVMQIQLKADKDETDTQAACALAVAKGANRVIIAGGLGGRMDHSMGNVQCLWMLHLEGVQASIESGSEAAHIVTERYPLGQYEGDTFSLIPLLPQTEVFRMRGVRYPLDHTPLMLGSTLGISNIVTEKDAQLVLQSGAVLLLVNLREALH